VGKNVVPKRFGTFISPDFRDTYILEVLKTGQEQEEQVQESLRAPENPISGPNRPKVAVVVVHGVNAKTPDKEFSNLNAVTDLLTNHDFTNSGISYSVPEYTAVQVRIDDVPKGEKTSKGDRGTEYTGELLERFSSDPYYYKTQRRETTRRNLDRTKAGEDIDVHLYEMFWADLSRPVALSGLHSIVALFELLFNVCSLGRKSLRAAQAENRSTFTWPVLSFLQVSIEWITTLGIPLANAWFLGAALTKPPVYDVGCMGALAVFRRSVRKEPARALDHMHR